MTRKFFALLLVAASFSAAARAQSDVDLPDAPKLAPAPTLRNLPRNILAEQRDIWTSPLRMNDAQFFGGIVLIAAAGGLGSKDSDIMRKHFLDTNTASHANTASNGLTGLFVAAPVAYFGFGHFRHNTQSEQTGIMAGEAIADSLVVNEVFKIASRRERPTVDNARGKFFQSGVNFDSSFASNHSTVAWSSATVIASESDSMLVKLAAYSLATGVSVTRVVGRDHFPSDVLVGSAIGWAIGRYVHHRHHIEDYNY
ncbi:MAG: phosphatase PAP2 family protein [Terracidiphilus sp.]|nr:phosphatase PAP2 family protein [Terracidiphilus sp.]